jgi:hypothetical protein
MPRSRLAVRLLALLLSFPILTTSAVFAETVATLGDASIVHGAGSWTISAGGASMALSIDPAEDFAVTSFRSPSGVEWLRAGTTDTVVTAGGVPRTFGRRSDGFTYSSASARTNGLRLELDATYVLLPQNLQATRHIAVVLGSPTFEVWTTFASNDDP